MRALWLAPLLLCLILSSVNAACPKGCTKCDSSNRCTACEIKGYALYNGYCYPCQQAGCDKCIVVTEGGKQYTECLGSCQNGCTQCNYNDYTCAQCSAGLGVYRGQCSSCQGECDKCVFNPQGDGRSAMIQCTGSCRGGCASCMNGNTCFKCRSGYVLDHGVCFACNGCSECRYVPIDSYRGVTQCIPVIVVSDTPAPTPQPTPTPTPTPTPATNQDTNNNNNNYYNNNNNSSTSSSNLSMLFIFVFVGVLIAAIFFFMKKNKQSQRDNIQQDYASAMAAEKQRQAALNIPAPNYQYQPPQSYPPQGYQQGYPQGYPQGNQQAPRY